MLSMNLSQCFRSSRRNFHLVLKIGTNVLGLARQFIFPLSATVARKIFKVLEFYLHTAKNVLHLYFGKSILRLLIGGDINAH